MITKEGILYCWNYYLPEVKRQCQGQNEHWTPEDFLPETFAELLGIQLVKRTMS